MLQKNKSAPIGSTVPPPGPAAPALPKAQQTLLPPRESGTPPKVMLQLCSHSTDINLSPFVSDIAQDYMQHLFAFRSLLFLKPRDPSLGMHLRTAPYSIQNCSRF